MHSLCNVTYDLGLFKRFIIALGSLYNIYSLTSNHRLLCSQA